MKLETRRDPFGPRLITETRKKIFDYLEKRKDAKNIVTPYASNVDLQVESKDLPLKVVHVGDTHFAHDAADPTALDKAVEETSDGYLVMQGNIIEGISPVYTHTNTTKAAFDVDDQVEVVRSILEPLDKKNRVIPVTGNFCHEGWTAKLTMNPTRYMVKRETKILDTGGHVNLRNRRGKLVGVMEVYHNPGKGGTKLSPEGAARARSREVPVGNEKRPDVVISAHTHMLSAAQEVFVNPVLQKDVISTFGTVGTAKGTEENPDRFLTAIGVPPREQPADSGQGFVVIWKKGREGKLSPYPVAGYERARVMYDAEKLYDTLEKRNLTDEVEGELMASNKFRIPKPKFLEEESTERAEDDAAKAEGICPLYSNLSYELTSDLPVRIQFVGNLRVGTTSFERKKLKTLLTDIESNPWAYFFATRKLVNEGTSNSLKRRQILEDLGKVLGQGKESILGIMLTDELRHHAWVSDIKRKVPEQNGDGETTITKHKSEAVYPGDWLSRESEIKGVPLMMPQSVVSVDLGEQRYILYLKDKLQYFTSLLNPEHGMTRIQQVWGIDADALVGGDTEVIGWRTWMRPYGQLEVVVPGGFAEYTGKGIGNRVAFPTGGQGLILYPDKKLLYSFATMEDGKDMHRALWLHSAIEKANMTRKVERRIKTTPLKREKKIKTEEKPQEENK